jgi:hypothetical protein
MIMKFIWLVNKIRKLIKVSAELILVLRSAVRALLKLAMVLLTAAIQDKADGYN